MDREEFAKQFIQKGKQSGASKEDITKKLQVALNEYDSQNSGMGQTPPSDPSFVQNIGSALIEPAKKYGNMVMGAMAEGVNKGTELYATKVKGIDPEAAREAIYSKPNPFLNEKEVEQFSDPKRAAIEGTKRTAGMSSYFVPGGTSAKAAITSGAVAGGLYGLSDTDEEATLADYVKNVTYGAAGGAAGASAVHGLQTLSSKAIASITRKAQNILQSKPQIPDEIADKAVEKILSKASNAETGNVSSTAETVYGSGFNFSKKGQAFEKLKPQQTFKTMLQDKIWGTPGQISQKVNRVTGEDGVVSNIVKQGLNEIGDNIDIPSNLVSPEEVTGLYTTLTPKDVNSISVRLAKTAPGSSITGKDANKLFDFQQTLEKEAWDTLSRNISDSKALEYAQLKLLYASRIEQVLDKSIDQSGITTQLSKDPAIIAWLGDNVSENFARRFAETGGDLRALRSLQKDYVRMGRIVELSSQENSSLGKTMFKWVDQLPGVGPVISSVSNQIESVVGTGAPILTKSAMETANNVTRPIGQGLGQINTIMNKGASRIAPVVGASQMPGLGQTPPQL